MSKKRRVQYRYYDIPPESFVLALMGNGWVREYGNDMDELHFHNHLEVGYCYEGEGVMNYDGKKYSYKSGMISIVPPNYPHTTNSRLGHQCKWEYLFIDTEDFLEGIYSDKMYLKQKIIKNIYSDAILLDINQNKEINYIVLGIFNEMRNKGLLHTESVKGLLLTFLINVARISKEERGSESVNSKINIIQPAINFVTTNYFEKIKIKHLADICHLSETHFRRIFFENMRLSPLDYITLIRLEAVCRLLRTTDDSIYNIAPKCGFASITSLNRYFKRFIGVTPNKWRRDEDYYENKLKNQNVLPYEGWRW